MSLIYWRNYVALDVPLRDKTFAFHARGDNQTNIWSQSPGMSALPFTKMYRFQTLQTCSGNHYLYPSDAEVTRIYEP